MSKPGKRRFDRDLLRYLNLNPRGKYFIKTVHVTLIKKLADMNENKRKYLRYYHIPDKLSRIFSNSPKSRYYHSSMSKNQLYNCVRLLADDHTDIPDNYVVFRVEDTGVKVPAISI